MYFFFSDYDFSNVLAGLGSEHMHTSFYYSELFTLMQP